MSTAEQRPAGGGWSEDLLHRWLARQPWPEGLVGSRGHDAAVIGERAGPLAMCADQCIEGIHFLREVGGEAAGRKAVLRTLSDLAATAAEPVAVTLTLRAPASTPEAWVQSALTGARAAAASHGAELVAGDLAAGPGAIHLSVSALGEVPSDRIPVGRDRARAGQLVLLSGPVGGSLISGRHLAPVPRLAEGRAIALAGAAAMMDVSDGLAWDLHRLARASSVQLCIDLERLPIHPDAVRAAEAEPGTTALQRALHDGEDHELIATLDPDAWRAFSASNPDHPWRVIGAVEAWNAPATEAAAQVQEEEDAPRLWLKSSAGEQPWHPASGGWTYG